MVVTVVLGGWHDSAKRWISLGTATPIFKFMSHEEVQIRRKEHPAGVIGTVEGSMAGRTKLNAVGHGV